MMCAHEHSSRRGVFSLGYSSRASESGRLDPSVFPFGVAQGGGHRAMVCGELLLHERREGEPLNLKQLWTAALGELQVGLSRAQYDTWFKDTQVVSEIGRASCRERV